MRRGALAGLAAVLLVAFVPGCGRPDDEVWLRLLGFRSPGLTTNLSVVSGQLLDNATDSVDAAFENASFTVGGDTGGTGIRIRRARLEYTMQGAAPPAYEFPVTLYLPAPKAGEPTSGTLSGLPIVPAALKQWLQGNLRPLPSTVHLTAKVTFFAAMDSGGDLDVDGSIPIVLSSGGTAATTVSVSASDAQASEGTPENPGAFTVARTGSTDAALTVGYTVGGTATSGADYEALDGSVDLMAGAASATIAVTPVTDSVAEGDETVVITLSAGTGYTLGSQKSATVTIQETALASVTIAASDATADESSLDPGEFTVTRSGSTAAALTVSYTVGGTATKGIDYQTLSGSVVIPAGSAEAKIAVTPKADSSPAEARETVIVTLSAGTGYTLGTARSATVFIEE